MQEKFEGALLRNAVKKRHLIDGLGGQAEPAGFDGLDEPLPFFRIAQVSEVVAARGGVDAPQRLDHLQSVRLALGDGPNDQRSGRARRSRSVMP